MTDIDLEQFVRLLDREKPFIHHPLTMENFEYIDDGRVHITVIVDEHKVFDIWTKKSDVTMSWRD